MQITTLIYIFKLYINDELDFFQKETLLYFAVMIIYIIWHSRE
jgi:hypothetical protein